ncbi:2-hydroxyacid dehydrogenase [Salinimicrobium soli]|uniref:2-hydroxyacid dehydrogenase n=1 Tax=Salinimicrobium soli TaxID=1254399 RepID=UPI003AAD4106
MSLLIICPGKDPEVWKKALQEYDPEIEVEVFPEVKKPEAVEMALSWNHPTGNFKSYPNLRVVASMGAGIDHIFHDPQLPKQVQVTRVVDEKLTEDMSNFVLALALDHIREISYHHSNNGWDKKMYRRPEETRIGIMGLGVLGMAVAEKLKMNGFPVSGWAAGPKKMVAVNTFFGEEQLDDFLAEVNVLVCLLPLTPETENILNKSLFQKLPKDAYLINVARGKHLVENDLLEMIDNGHLSGASLDVFRQEPLPKEHPFWKHPKIQVTPHNASITSPRSVVPQIADNYHRLKKGDPLTNLVSRQKGY